MQPSRQRSLGPSSISVLLIRLLVFSLLDLVRAQSTAALPAPTNVAPSVTPVPSTAYYTYIGCYNETTGDASVGSVRALAGGNMTTSAQMTVNYCLTYRGSSAYAGLEYGRECWCAPYLNVASNKLPDASCTDACEGDGTEVCGGSLTLTLYQHKNATTSGAAGLKGWRVGYGVIYLGLLGAVWL